MKRKANFSFVVSVFMIGLSVVISFLVYKSRVDNLKLTYYINKERELLSYISESFIAEQKIDLPDSLFCLSSKKKESVSVLSGKLILMIQESDCIECIQDIFNTLRSNKLADQIVILGYFKNPRNLISLTLNLKGSIIYCIEDETVFLGSLTPKFFTLSPGGWPIHCFSPLTSHSDLTEDYLRSYKGNGQ